MIFAPAVNASSASRQPIVPFDRLVWPRTSSHFSIVPPLVINTVFPCNMMLHPCEFPIGYTIMATPFCSIIWYLESLLQQAFVVLYTSESATVQDSLVLIRSSLLMNQYVKNNLLVNLKSPFLVFQQDCKVPPMHMSATSILRRIAVPPDCRSALLQVFHKNSCCHSDQAP